jgi:coproporphyrinogen III oxidase
MSGDLVPVSDQRHEIPDEFGSFHWQQDTSCSASRKASYLVQKRMALSYFKQPHRD